MFVSTRRIEWRLNFGEIVKAKGVIAFRDSNFQIPAGNEIDLAETHLIRTVRLDETNRMVCVKSPPLQRLPSYTASKFVAGVQIFEFGKCGVFY